MLDIITISSLALLPLAAMPAVSGASDILHKISPDVDHENIDTWMVNIHGVIDIVKRKEGLIPEDAMAIFFDLVQEYLTTRRIYEKQISRGHLIRLFWKRGVKKEHTRVAHTAWKFGLSISTNASVLYEFCAKNHRNGPTHTTGKYEGKCLECFSDSYAPPSLTQGENSDSDSSEAQEPFTWAYLLDSAMEAAKRESKGGLLGVKGVGVKGAVSQNKASHLQRTAAADSKSVNAVIENNVTATGTMVEDDRDNEDAVSALSAIHLDAEESHILGAVVEKKLLLAGFRSCEDVHAWKSEALLQDEARAHREQTI